MLGRVIDRCSWAILLVLICVVGASAEQYSQLKMIHVIFRHGERTAASVSAGERYPKDPHLNEDYFPVGPGYLTNNGKLTMYKLGTFLRQRYNRYLGEIYYPEVTRIRSTNNHRAMMSAQLVNAGLWPPPEAQQWNKNLLWNPIPYEYSTAPVDSLMFSYKCPAYKAEYERILQSEEVKRLIDPYLEFFAYLSEHTGLSITKPQQAFFLYHTLQSEMNYNLTLPSWTNGYFPDGELYDLALLEYDISNWSNLIKRLYGGPLIRDVLQDYNKLLMDNPSGESGPKIKLYSGHESNICSVLKALGVWTPHVPDFSAAIIFELHQLNNYTNEFGIQILYFLGKSEKTISLTLPGCTQICPIDEFTKVLAEVIPDDVDALCRMKTESIKDGSSSASLQVPLYIVSILQLWFLLVR